MRGERSWIYKLFPLRVDPCVNEGDTSAAPASSNRLDRIDIQRIDLGNLPLFILLYVHMQRPRDSDQAIVVTDFPVVLDVRADEMLNLRRPVEAALGDRIDHLKLRNLRRRGVGGPD